MSIKSVLKATVVAVGFVASGAVLAHPMPIPGLPPATYWD